MLAAMAFQRSTTVLLFLAPTGVIASLAVMLLLSPIYGSRFAANFAALPFPIFAILSFVGAASAASEMRLDASKRTFPSILLLLFGAIPSIFVAVLIVAIAFSFK